MAETLVQSGLKAQQWDDKFFTEYVTENRFASEFGTNESSIIQVKEDLSKKKGDRVHFALVNKLTNDAITGRDVLEGNEEEMVTRSHAIIVDKRRNGVRIAEIDEQFSSMSLRDAGKATLKEWSMQDTETLIIQALASKNGVDYDLASEDQKNAWLVDNADRAYFASGYAGADHSAGLAELDVTNDLLTAADLIAMKRKALVTANPKIRPIRVRENGRHYFVVYVHPNAMRDLKNETSSPIMAAQREVVLEMENNRLFQGGDLLWDGLIIKEIHDMFDELTFTGVGDQSATVVPAFLVGAQALGVAYAKRWKSKEETFDYGDKKGIAIESIYGVEKLQFGSGDGDTDDLKDHGVVSGYFASSTAD